MGLVSVVGSCSEVRRTNTAPSFQFHLIKRRITVRPHSVTVLAPPRAQCHRQHVHSLMVVVEI